MDRIREYLYGNREANAYIIRALNYGPEPFRLEAEFDSRGGVLALAAVWEGEKIATLRGDRQVCRKWFARWSGAYSFYDLEPQLAGAILMDLRAASQYAWRDYVVWKTPHSGGSGRISYAKPDLAEWDRISHLFREKYEKVLDQVRPGDKDGLVAYQGEIPVSVMYLEKVSDTMALISSFYTLPGWRNQGIGTKFLQSVLEDNRGRNMVLFAVRENKPAMAVYEKSGLVCQQELVTLNLR